MTGPVQPGVVALKRRRAIFENRSLPCVCGPYRRFEWQRGGRFSGRCPTRSQRSNLVTGVVVVPVRYGDILLLNCHRHPVGRRVFEVPRGFLDEDEEPFQAALEELTEENRTRLSAGCVAFPWYHSAENGSTVCPCRPCS